MRSIVIYTGLTTHDVKKGRDDCTDRMERLLPLFGVDPAKKRPIDLAQGWKSYSVKRSDGGDAPVQVILVASGPKNMAEVKRAIGSDKCVVLFVPRCMLYLKALGKSLSVQLDGEGELEKARRTLSSCNISGAKRTLYLGGLLKAIDRIPAPSAHFDNRGVFSNHYLRNRLWDDLRRDIDSEARAAGMAAGDGANAMLKALGWNMGDAKKDGGGGQRNVYRLGATSIVVAPKGHDLSVRTSGEVAPSYTAVAELKNSKWVIVTNGREWRLYTSRVSASTTNYLRIDTGDRHSESLRYLAALFGAATHAGAPPLIDNIFDQAHLKAASLEDDLRKKILGADGLFLDIAKGVLDHDMKKKFRPADLASAKETALTVMYRVWFVLYAESRNLLPINDPKYQPISLRAMRSTLDGYDADLDGHGCWDALLGLFEGIRDGSPKHNLPQYDGDLFRIRPNVDHIRVRNRFMAAAMRSLLETDGKAVDYGDLGVRHLGSIYEALLEFEIRQADKDIMLLEKGGKVRVVESGTKSTYSYKKNDLYLASGADIASRKASASFYTPGEIVSFLVRQGLEPLLKNRASMVAGDVRKYKKNPTKRNRLVCMDRILDLQVLDPAMGSGHFLVEALNQITAWATDTLSSHPDHPLVAEIENDRKTVLEAQKQRGVTIDETLLTADVLLKRRIMKRCIFGVDVNELAVELARLSLWLDSFAIGVPLTYLNHHIRKGDSTIGEWLNNMTESKDHTMDDYLPNPAEHVGSLDRVSESPDVTVEQALGSRRDHEEYERKIESHRIALNALVASTIDPTTIPQKARHGAEFIRRMARSSDAGKDVVAARKRTAALAEKYSFFHWELEMMDAFTDKRRGFDLVVGNPPWEKLKPSKDEFFTPYDPRFRALKTSIEKKKRANTILKDHDIKKRHDEYTMSFKEKAAFYRTFEMQGSGDSDLWQLILERMLSLVTDNGAISVVVPSQFLSNTGSVEMRKHVLGMDISQAYVFENRKKIFPIHSSYRFMLLTARNRTDGPDKFKAAFYLHRLSSLTDDSIERDKFTECSKARIRATSPDNLAVPEAPTKAATLLERLSKCPTLGTRSEGGWQVSIARGFDTSGNSDLFKTDGTGWPVLKGSNIHQFNHHFSTPDFTADKIKGLRALEKKKVYLGRCRDFYGSPAILFRNVSSSTNMRTVIASIVPPHRFHAHSLGSIVLTKNDTVLLGDEYNRRSAYIVGIINSMVFDFIARSKTQMNMAPIIASLAIPKRSEFDDRIAFESARLVCGIEEKKGKKDEATIGAFASTFDIVPNIMSPADKIDTTARIDAMVAHAYELSRAEYKMVLDSFKFGEDPSLHKAKSADWSENHILRRFYGEVRKAALYHFDTILDKRAC